jgi:nitroreductase
MRRRAFLSNASTVLITFVGGSVWRARADEDPEFGVSLAFEPWRTWRAEAREGRLAMVRAAILTSNAFNTQPWLFKVTEHRIELYADSSRQLGAFDPYLRELHFSVGCALENLMLSAAKYGYRASLSFPAGKLETPADQPQPALVARVDLSRDAPPPSELYEAIPHRHTNRTPFDATRAIPQSFLDALRALANNQVNVKLFVYTTDDERNGIAEVIFEATQIVTADPAVQRDTTRWLRRSMAEVEAHHDGPFVGPSSVAKAATNPGS